MTPAGRPAGPAERRRSLRNGAAAAGATAAATVLAVAASLIALASDAQNVVLYAFGHLTVSIALIGVYCTIVAFVAGYVRGRAASPWISAVFVALTPGVAAYVFTAFWLVNALYVLLLAVLIGLVAAPIYVFLERKFVPPLA